MYCKRNLLRVDMFTMILYIFFTAILEFLVKYKLLHVDKLVMFYTSKTVRIHVFVILVFYKTGNYLPLINLPILLVMYHSLCDIKT